MKVDSLVPLLQVFDLPASIAFYRSVLGFELEAGDDSWWALLRLDGARLMLNTAYEDHERPVTPEPARIAAHGDTCLYFQTPNPDSVYAHLRAKGWPASAPVTRSYGMRQVTTLDPDGFELCFQREAKV